MTLRITSLRAENLPPEDGKTCDPYVEVKIGDKKITTETIKKNHISPQWTDLKDMQWPWDGRSALPSFEFTVWDYDTFSRNDFLGFVHFSPHPFMLNTEQRLPLNIRNEKDSSLLKDHGTLGNLYVTISSDVVVEGTPSPTSSPARTAQTQQQQQQPPVAAAAATQQRGSPALQQQQQQQTGGGGAAAPRDVTVRFASLRGKGLAPVDGKTCDPYVKVKLGGKLWQTESIKENCNPQWKKLGEFSFPWDGRGPLPEIEFEVIDANRVFSDENIGDAKLQLHPTMIGTEAFSNLHLGPKCKQGLKEKYGSLGSLHFVLESEQLAAQTQSPAGARRGLEDPQAQQYRGGRSNPSSGMPTPRYPSGSPSTGSPGVYQSSQQQQQQMLTTGVLELTIIGAKDLLPRDLVPGVDAFVVVRGEKRDGSTVKLARTKVCHGTLSPVWNDAVSLRLDPNIAEVFFTVFDLDAGGSQDFLGECTLPCDLSTSSSGRQDIILRPRQNNNEDARVLREFKAANFGSLSVDWNHVAESQASAIRAGRSFGTGQPRTPNQGAMVASPHSPLAGQVQQQGLASSLDVTVLSVTNLPTTCNPYVRLRYGDQTFENPEDSALSTTMGMWNFRSSFFLDAARSTHDVRVEVRSDDRLIGSAVLSMASDTTKQKTFVLPLQCGGSINGEVTLVAVVSQPTAMMYSAITAAELPDSVLALTVVSAEDLSPEGGQLLNPYLIVGVSGPSNELEYTSPPVPGTSPQWYFQLPDLHLDPQDIVTVGVWDEDPFGFDRSLGQCKLDCNRFLRGPGQEQFQLEDREGKRDAMQRLGKLVVEWNLTPKLRRGGLLSAPHIVEISIHEASNLAVTLNPTAVVRVTCDDQPGNETATKCVPKSSPKWDECLQLRVDGLRSRLRLSLWDSDSRSAEFLGECYFDLRQPAEGKPVQLSLRPRQDPHFYVHDVALLNRYPTGLGILTASFKTYSVREYEDQVRERLRKQGASYQLSLLVSDSADLSEKAAYFVKAVAGGDEQLSQVETSSHPRFRKTFNFSLQYDTEMVTLYLVKRTGREDEVLGDVTFPVNPPERIGVEPTVTWVSLKPAISTSPSHEPAPGAVDRAVKLLIRWRTTRRVEGATAPPAGNQTSGLMDSSSSYVTPVRPGGYENVSMNPNEASMRAEIDALRQEVQTLRKASPRRGQGSLYVANVYCPQHNKISSYKGDTNAFVSDVLSTVSREFGLLHTEDYALVFRGNVLPPTRYIADHVPNGETVFLVVRSSIEGSAAVAGAGMNGNNSSQLQTTPAHAIGTSSTTTVLPTYTPRGGSTGGYQHANPSSMVVERMKSYGTDTPLVSAIATLPFSATHPTTNSLIQMCVSRQLNGFARPTYSNGTTELFIQGVPLKVADACTDVLAHVPTALVEEVHGYIPILGLGYRVTTDRTEGERMFELCSLPFQQGGEQQSWFYHAGDDNVSGRSARGVRYVDERAS